MFLIKENMQVGPFAKLPSFAGWESSLELVLFKDSDAQPGEHGQGRASSRGWAAVDLCEKQGDSELQAGDVLMAGCRWPSVGARLWVGVQAAQVSPRHSLSAPRTGTGGGGGWVK